MTNNTKRSVGEELTRRLKRFTDDLETVKSTADLPKKYTVRRVKLKLESRPLSSKDVKAIREILNASQAIFAQFIGVSVGTVRDWEQGKSSPNGAAQRLMSEISRDPEYWLNAFAEVADSTEIQNEESACSNLR